MIPRARIKVANCEAFRHLDSEGRQRVTNAVEQAREAKRVEGSVFQEDFIWAEVAVDELFFVDQFQQVNDLQADVDGLYFREECLFRWQMISGDDHFAFAHFFNRGCRLFNLEAECCHLLLDVGLKRNPSNLVDLAINYVLRQLAEVDNRSEAGIANAVHKEGFVPEVLEEVVVVELGIVVQNQYVVN